MPCHRGCRWASAEICGVEVRPAVRIRVRRFDRAPPVEIAEGTGEANMTAPPRRPTMRDVAALAGVGFKTVSRVVNGEPGVSPDLGARVQRAIEQLDYRPNLGASSLRR